MKNKLNKSQLEGLASELNAVREEVMQNIGQDDANYIRRIIRIQRSCEIIGRIVMVLGFFNKIGRAHV